MPDIDRQLFGGKDNLSENDLKSLSAEDLSIRATGEVLRRFGWEGRSAAAVGLKLSPDNTTAAAGRLILLGVWDQKIKIQAKKIFGQADEDTVLEISELDLAVFRCREGEMWSRYTPQEALKYEFYQGEKVLDDDAKQTQGISEFCVRAVAQLAKGCGPRYGIWVQLAIMVYPISDGEMMQLAEQTSNPAWPGIRLAEGEIPVLPTAGKGKEVAGGKDWGCPVGPVLVPGTPWEAAPGPISEQDISDACGALLNTGCGVEAAASADSLQKKWNSLLENPDRLTVRRPDKTWPKRAPAPEKQPAKKGNNI